MSEEQQPRDPEQIKPEYSKLAMQLGDLDYRIMCMKEESDMLKKKMRELNHEAAKYKAAQDALAAKPTEAEVVV